MSPKGIFDNVQRHFWLSQEKGTTGIWRWSEARDATKHLAMHRTGFHTDLSRPNDVVLTLRSPVLDSVFTYGSLSPSTARLCPFPGLFLFTVSALILVLLFFALSKKETTAFLLLSHVSVFCTSLPEDLVSSGDRRPHSQIGRHPLKAKLQSGFRFFSVSLRTFIFLFCMQMGHVHLDAFSLSLCLPQVSSFTWKESIEIFSVFFPGQMLPSQ